MILIRSDGSREETNDGLYQLLRNKPNYYLNNVITSDDKIIRYIRYANITNVLFILSFGVSPGFCIYVHGTLVKLSRVDKDEADKYISMYTNNEFDELFDQLETRRSIILNAINGICASTRPISKVKRS